MKGFKSIRVIIDREYLIPMYNEKISEINGWTIGEIINNWFEQVPIWDVHAARDSHRVGHSDKVIRVIPSDFIEMLKNKKFKNGGRDEKSNIDRKTSNKDVVG